MKGLVVGLGSMGKRRVRLMQTFFSDIALCGVDSAPARRDEAAAQFALPCYASIEEACAAWAPQLGFVCTSPLSHAAITTQLLEQGLHVFTEINLVADGYAHNTALAQQKSLVLFLSSTPLYRRETQYIEDAVRRADAPLSYQYHVGQYLPDWHPWENYTDFFVGERRTNGCRELLGIELPWMARAFGNIQSAAAVAQRLTSLRIDYPDRYLITLTHAGGITGQLAVDVVSRKATRALTVVGEQLFLRWNGTPDSLSVYDFDSKSDVAVDTYDTVQQDSRYANNIIENAYVDELAAFFDTLAGKPARRHTFEADAVLLGVIDRIEEVGA